MPNPALHLTGAAILVSRGITLTLPRANQMYGRSRSRGALSSQADCLCTPKRTCKMPLLRRSGFQWQVKRNVFSRKEGKSSSSNKDLSHKMPGYSVLS